MSAKPIPPGAGGTARPARTQAQERLLAAYDQGLQRLLGRSGRPVIDLALRPQHEFRLVMQKPPGVSKAAYTRQLRQLLGTGVRVEPLFEEYRPGQDLPTLADFFLVRWPGLDSATLAENPYDIGYALQDATKSVSATPESTVQASAANPCREPNSSPDPSKQGGGSSMDSADWYLRAANVPGAWDLLAAQGISDRGAGIVVGHIDTGIVRHTLLEPRVDFGNGKDYLREGQLPVDPLPTRERPGDVPGHGTFSSSVIAGAVDPATRFSGVAPGATLLPFRVTTNVVVGPFSHVAKAIVRATAGNADLISISLGGPALSPHLHYAVNNATYNNVMVIAAAGQCVKFVVLPAALRNCVSAGGAKLTTTSGAGAADFDVLRDRLTLWSRSASGKVSIVAPAKDIPCASPNRDSPDPNPHSALTDQQQGTTFATAMVAGAAVLWLRRHGRKPLSDRYRNWRSVTTIFKRLLAESAHQPPGWQANWGPGVLDVKRLLERPLPPGAPGFPDLPAARQAFLDEHNRMDVAEWFEDVMSQFDPQAVRAALRRLFPAGTEQEWQERLAQFGAEALARIATNARAGEEFAAAVRAEAQATAASAAEAAERAAEAARALADEASGRLRQALRR